MNRRDIIGGGMAAGFAGLAGADVAAAAQSDEDPRIAAQLQRLADSTERHYQVTDLREYSVINEIRSALRQHLRANHKFPDGLEVGSDVWEAVYDWHIQHGLALDVSRGGDGRYAIKFMFTTLLMRTDVPQTYMGVPYDGAVPR